MDVSSESRLNSFMPDLRISLGAKDGNDFDSIRVRPVVHAIWKIAYNGLSDVGQCNGMEMRKLRDTLEDAFSFHYELTA